MVQLVKTYRVPIDGEECPQLIPTILLCVNGKVIQMKLVVNNAVGNLF